MDFALLLTVGKYILLGLGAASAALHVISPATKTTKDDEATKWVDTVADKLKWLVVPTKLK